MDSLIQEAKRRGSGLQVALRRAGYVKVLRRRSQVWWSIHISDSWFWKREILWSAGWNYIYWQDTLAKNWHHRVWSGWWLRYYTSNLSFPRSEGWRRY